MGGEEGDVKTRHTRKASFKSQTKQTAAGTFECLGFHMHQEQTKTHSAVYVGGPAAEITTNVDIITYEDLLIKVIVCEALLGSVSHCRLMGEMIFLGTSPGHRSIRVSS